MAVAGLHRHNSAVVQEVFLIAGSGHGLLPELVFRPFLPEDIVVVAVGLLIALLRRIDSYLVHRLLRKQAPVQQVRGAFVHERCELPPGVLGKAVACAKPAVLRATVRRQLVEASQNLRELYSTSASTKFSERMRSTSDILPSIERYIDAFDRVSLCSLFFSLSSCTTASSF